MRGRKRQIALVCPDIGAAGGLRSVLEFILEAVNTSDAYAAVPISLATSRSDASSRRLLHPTSLPRGPRVAGCEAQGVSYGHYGANLAEIEWMRYAPRDLLTTELKKFDLVQIIGGSPAWAHVASKAGIPTAVHAATLAQWERAGLFNLTPSGLWRKVMATGTGRLDKSALRSADHIFTMNSRMMAVAERHAPGRVSMLYPGVDTSWFSPLGYEVRGPLLSVGRLAEPRKNWPGLILAYHLATQIEPDLPNLLIAGIGGLTTSDEQLIRRLDLAERIVVISSPSPTELRELYRSASLFVLASNEEGFGIVVAEAMASGLPVVASLLAGTSETVLPGVNGALVPRGVDFESRFAQELCELWANPSVRAAMSIASRERSFVFDRERSGRLLVDTYDAMLGQTRS